MHSSRKHIARFSYRLGGGVCLGMSAQGDVCPRVRVYLGGCTPSLPPVNRMTGRQV